MYSTFSYVTNSISNIIRITTRSILTGKKIQTMNFSSRNGFGADADERIVWMDLEMTGLDVDKDHIMEVACVVTDHELNIIAKGPNIIIHQSDEILSNMNKWCLTQHRESGLTEACKNSKISLQQAENELLKFLRKHVPEKKCPLGGNSIYMDRLFIQKYMPVVNQYLHYRVIDVSSIKELAKRWYKQEFSNIPPKKFLHRSMDDICASIEELNYYKKHIFKA